MKKLLTLAALFVFVLGASQTFAQGYKQGDNLLNVGIGLNSYYSGGIPIGASFEHGFTDVISAGANLDYFSHTYAVGYKFSIIYIGVRGSYHFNELLNIQNDKVDLYAGLGLGYRNFKWSDSAFNGLAGSYGSGAYFTGFVGGRYYFTDAVGGFVELGGGGSTNFRLGATFKF